jgi:hypothetical protein
MHTPTTQITVTHAAIDHTFEGTLEIRMKENGFDTATFLVSDKDATKIDIVSAGKSVSLGFANKNETMPTVFTGKIYRVDPTQTLSGYVLKAECDAYGCGLDYMLCGEEYGTQSRNPTLDTILEIIDDATNGIIPNWAEKILGGNASGYTYTTEIETIVGTIPYYYSAFKPCSKTINDLCDIVQAIKGTSAGCHWRVDSANRFLLATVGNHAYDVAKYWPTWWRKTQTESTLIEGENISVQLQQLDQEANYILYHSRLRKPANEIWTENNSASWGKVETLGTGDSAITDDSDATDVVAGNYSLNVLCESGGGGGLYFYYPSTQDMGVDITKIGGQFSIPTLSFYIRPDSDVGLSAGSTPFVELHNGAYNSANYFLYTIGGYLQANKWTQVVLPLGSYAKDYPYTGTDYIASEGGTPDWTDIDTIVFGFANSAAAAGTIHLDGLTINGYILRVASQTAGYSATDPCKIKLITDTQGKDDSLVASDDTGTIGRLAYAEYLKCKTTPYVGTIKIQAVNDIYPGQLIQLKAKKCSDTYQIDSTFRVTKVTHTISDSAVTTLEVTSDIINSVPQSVPNRVNKLYDAIRPEFQDRQATSLKTRDIDITLPILEKSY